MPVPEVDVRTFAAALADGAAVLDVREPSEYVQGHVPGAQLVPLSRLAAQLPLLPRHRQVFVVCETGARSHSAAERLQRAGLQPVVLSGGTAQWRSAHRPLVRGPHAA